MGRIRQQLDDPKVLWFLGDVEIRSQVEAVAAALEYTLVETATENATYEDIRATQLNSVWMRRRRTPVDVIIYLAVSDYDAEGLIWRVLRVAKEGSRIILIVKPHDDRTIEAIDHFEDREHFHLIAVDNFDDLEERLTTLLSNED